MKTMLLNRVLTYQLVLKTNFLGNIGPRPFLTECQYSPVWLEKVRLLNSLLYGTQSTHVYFEFSGVYEQIYAAYERSHGNNYIGKLRTMYELIRTLGSTSRQPCHIIKSLFLEKQKQFV